MREHWHRVSFSSRSLSFLLTRHSSVCCLGDEFISQWCSSTDCSVGKSCLQIKNHNYASSLLCLLTRKAISLCSLFDLYADIHGAYYSFLGPYGTNLWVPAIPLYKRLYIPQSSILKFKWIITQERTHGTYIIWNSVGGVFGRWWKSLEIIFRLLYNDTGSLVCI